MIQKIAHQIPWEHEQKRPIRMHLSSQASRAWIFLSDVQTLGLMKRCQLSSILLLLLLLNSLTFWYHCHQQSSIDFLFNYERESSRGTFLEGFKLSKSETWMSMVVLLSVLHQHLTSQFPDRVNYKCLCSHCSIQKGRRNMMFDFFWLVAYLESKGERWLLQISLDYSAITQARAICKMWLLRHNNKLRQLPM